MCVVNRRRHASHAQIALLVIDRPATLAGQFQLGKQRIGRNQRIRSELRQAGPLQPPLGITSRQGSQQCFPYARGVHVGAGTMSEICTDRLLCLNLADEHNLASIRYGKICSLSSLVHEVVHHVACHFRQARPPQEGCAGTECFDADAPFARTVVERDEAAGLQRHQQTMGRRRRHTGLLRQLRQCRLICARQHG